MLHDRLFCPDGRSVWDTDDAGRTAVAGDLRSASAAVSDPVIVHGPKGDGPITAAQFAEWVATGRGGRAGRHSTVFRVADGRVTAALRLPDVRSALQVASSAGAVATVNAVTRTIGIDRSGASRLIKAAVQGGFLALATSTTDSRHREVTLTDAGRVLMQNAHRWQEDVFDRLTTGWTEERRREFQLFTAELVVRWYALDLLSAPFERNRPEHADDLGAAQ